jgi:hypothetical protein
MIYKHEKWGDDKHYSLSHSSMGQWILKEFANRIKKTEITLSTEEKVIFEQRLKQGGWYELIR